MQDELFEMLVEKDEVTWQSILYDIVRTEQMDPWDLDVSKLTRRYIETLKKLKEYNLRISGKVVLAASILLRMKSNRLVGEDIGEFDSLITGRQEMSEQEFFDSLGEDESADEEDSILYEATQALVARTPQPRKRKISITDLVYALRKALEVKKRRVLRTIPPDVQIPQRKFDISKMIKNVYGSIVHFFSINREQKMDFGRLLSEGTKTEKVFVLISLLHLSDQRKIDLFQQEHFGSIEISLADSVGSDEEK
ncbi:MAG TPA: ScpA family protein [Candidatus Nanoarchaeia archaeon]|nr:ScpA family protein [Candidatus Nanoarchaeia archaeon]